MTGTTPQDCYDAKYKHLNLLAFRRLRRARQADSILRHPVRKDENSTSANCDGKRHPVLTSCLPGENYFTLASAKSLISLVGAQGIEPWTR